MKIPLSWLRKYVDVDLPPEELAHRLSMAGTEVEKIERIGNWDDVVVGHVRDVSQHPNADRLSIVTVEHGAGTSEVVCGAPNVAAGQKIAFASLGARLIDGYSGEPSRLKRSKIRGVVSEGMVCSEKELGLGDNHDGILVLDPDTEIGAPLGDIIGDTILELELTPNRPDCLGIVGVAREVSASTGSRVAPTQRRLPDRRRRCRLSRPRRHTRPRPVSPLHRIHHPRREDRPVAQMARRRPHEYRRTAHQQRGRRNELRDV